MDEADLAQRAEALFLAEALARVDQRAAEPQTICRDTECCLDCGEPIPTARRLAVPGCIRCRDCQAQMERRT